MRGETILRPSREGYTPPIDVFDRSHRINRSCHGVVADTMVAVETQLKRRAHDRFKSTLDVSIRNSGGRQSEFPVRRPTWPIAAAGFSSDRKVAAFQPR